MVVILATPLQWLLLLQAHLVPKTHWSLEFVWTFLDSLTLIWEPLLPATVVHCLQAWLTLKLHYVFAQPLRPMCLGLTWMCLFHLVCFLVLAKRQFLLASNVSRVLRVLGCQFVLHCVLSWWGVLLLLACVYFGGYSGVLSCLFSFNLLYWGGVYLLLLLTQMGWNLICSNNCMGKFVFMCVYYQNLVSFSNYAFVFNILCLFVSFLSIVFRYVVLRLLNVGNLKELKVIWNILMFISQVIENHQILLISKFKHTFVARISM